MDTIEALKEEYQSRLQSDNLLQFVTVELSPTPDGKVSLDHLKVKDDARGNGYAKRAVAILVDLCATANRYIVAIPKPLEESTDIKKLISLYRSQGFTHSVVSKNELICVPIR